MALLAPLAPLAPKKAAADDSKYKKRKYSEINPVPGKQSILFELCTGIVQYDDFDKSDFEKDFTDAIDDSNYNLLDLFLKRVNENTFEIIVQEHWNNLKTLKLLLGKKVQLKIVSPRQFYDIIVFYSNVSSKLKRRLDYAPYTLDQLLSPYDFEGNSALSQEVCKQIDWDYVVPSTSLPLLLFPGIVVSEAMYLVEHGASLGNINPKTDHLCILDLFHYFNDTHNLKPPIVKWFLRQSGGDIYGNDSSALSVMPYHEMNDSHLVQKTLQDSLKSAHEYQRYLQEKISAVTVLCYDVTAIIARCTPFHFQNYQKLRAQRLKRPMLLNKYQITEQKVNSLIEKLKCFRVELTSVDEVHMCNLQTLDLLNEIDRTIQTNELEVDPYWFMESGLLLTVIRLFYTGSLDFLKQGLHLSYAPGSPYTRYWLDCMMYFAEIFNSVNRVENQTKYEIYLHDFAIFEIIVNMNSVLTKIILRESHRLLNLKVSHSADVKQIINILNKNLNTLRCYYISNHVCSRLKNPTLLLAMIISLTQIDQIHDLFAETETQNKIIQEIILECVRVLEFKKLLDDLEPVEDIEDPEELFVNTGLLTKLVGRIVDYVMLKLGKDKKQKNTIDHLDCFRILQSLVTGEHSAQIVVHRLLATQESQTIVADALEQKQYKSETYGLSVSELTVYILSTTRVATDILKLIEMPLLFDTIREHETSFSKVQTIYNLCQNGPPFTTQLIERKIFTDLFVWNADPEINKELEFLLSMLCESSSVFQFLQILNESVDRGSIFEFVSICLNRRRCVDRVISFMKSRFLGKALSQVDEKKLQGSDLQLMVNLKKDSTQTSLRVLHDKLKRNLEFKLNTKESQSQQKEKVCAMVSFFVS